METIPGIARIIVALLVGCALASLWLEDSLARPKKPLIQYHCKCGCQYRDSSNKWHWGSDVTFVSSNCSLGAGMTWDCKSSDGKTTRGNLVGCESKGTVADSRAGGDAPPSVQGDPGPSNPKSPRGSVQSPDKK